MYTSDQLTQHKQELDLIGEFLHQPLRLLTKNEAEKINELEKDKYYLVVNYWYNVSRSDSLYLQDIASKNLELLFLILISSSKSQKSNEKNTQI